MGVAKLTSAAAYVAALLPGADFATAPAATWGSEAVKVSKWKLTGGAREKEREELKKKHKGVRGVRGGGGGGGQKEKREGQGEKKKKGGGERGREGRERKKLTHWFPSR